MLKRCYSHIYLREHTTYEDCTVCEEWKTFSIFRKWMVDQEWEDMHLDKDLLFKGNKLYSPETCAFIHQKVNHFILDCVKNRGKCLIGCYLHKKSGKYMAYCSNPFTGKRENLGLFKDEQRASDAWRSRKHELSCQLAESSYVTDEIVAEVLTNKYK